MRGRRRIATQAATPPAVAAARVVGGRHAPAASRRQAIAGGERPIRIGVLIVNLGTPDAAEPKAVRRYLKEFLTDPRVIERNSLLWKFLLNGLILPLRSRRKAHDYKKIWNTAQNESPLKTITRSQAEKLASILEPLGKHVIVDWAMRYASPSIASRLDALMAAVATASWSCRFIRNMRRQPPRRWPTRCFVS